MLFHPGDPERRPDAASGDHQLVVADLLAVVETHPMCLRIDAHDIAANEGHAGDGSADGISDVILGQRPGGNLIEQRAEELVGMPIHEDDVDPRRLAQQLGRIQAGEAGSDDDHLDALHVRMVSRTTRLRSRAGLRDGT